MHETLFANPAALTVGGAMVSSPILIHLINRMRFKRLRWAAMEFLLKSQKRNRRRLIIEQLLLLLLRCLLIALAAFLLARFIGFTFGGFEQTGNLAIPEAYGARWLVLDAGELPQLRPRLSLVYSDARFALFKLPPPPAVVPALPRVSANCDEFS